MSRRFGGFWAGLVVATWSLVLTAPGAAQQRGEEVIMLEEITIKVEPELPTVTMTIPRQEPEVRMDGLSRPLENFLTEGTQQAKPRRDEFNLMKIDDPKKLLAKVREP